MARWWPQCSFGLLAFVVARASDDRWAAFSQLGWQSALSAAESGLHGGQHRGHRREVDHLKLVVILAVRQRNLEFLEDRARSVSDPTSTGYGQYYSRDEVNEISGPADSDVKTVRDFLKGEGEVTFSKAGDLVRFVCTVPCVEHVFNTTIDRNFHKLRPGHTPFRAATPIRLPPRVADALDGVSLNAPIFMPPRPKVRKFPAFRYPLTGRYSPRVNPYELLAGDTFLTLRFVVYCKDGEANRDSLQVGLCYGSGQDEGSRVVSLEIVVLQDPAMQKVVQLPASTDIFGERRAICEDGKRSVYCYELNVTIGMIQNYAGTTARVRVHFGDGSVSPFSNSSELPTVWPLPYTTPSMLSNLYGIPLNTPIRDPRNIISVAEFVGQYYNPADLESFFKLMGVRSWNGAGRTQPQVLGPNKPIAGSVLGGEAQLDLQYIMAMAANVTTWFWSVPGTELFTQQEPFLEWLMQVADLDDETKPLVHSISYGDDEMSMPVWFKRRVNLEFMKLALRGVSILVASGDDGANGQAARHDKGACRSAAPEFPASSPWVTAVGGTQISKAPLPVCRYQSDSVIVTCSEEGEVACTAAKGGGITSGGGFSSDFDIPWYQKDAVKEYLKQTDSPVPDPDGPWKFNPRGRAYPDISGVSSNFLVWMGDHLEPTSGTSASTPLLAAMVAHLNEERLQRGLPPLGFLNPLLYRLAEDHPEAFNDVVIGDNRCSAELCCETGFGAARGWDAVTGFGSPNFRAMKALLHPNVADKAPLSPVPLTRLAEPAPSAGALPSPALLLGGLSLFAAGAALGLLPRRHLWAYTGAGAARQDRLSGLQAPLRGGCGSTEA